MIRGKKMRKFVITIIFIILIVPVGVVSAQSDYQQEYDEMLESSGANELFDELPENTREYLSDAGIKGVDNSAL